MIRWLLPPLLVLATMAPHLAGAGTPFDLWLSGEANPGHVCPIGVLQELVPPGAGFQGCSFTPSTISALGPPVRSIINQTFTSVNGFNSSQTLGSSASLHLLLGPSGILGNPHPLLRVNATVDLLDGATTTRIAWGEVPCAWIPVVTNGDPFFWTCDVPLTLTQSTAAAGTSLRLTVTYTHDETLFSPVIYFGAGASHLEFSG
jgi:hypothetical protein